MSKRVRLESATFRILAGVCLGIALWAVTLFVSLNSDDGPVLLFRSVGVRHLEELPFALIRLFLLTQIVAHLILVTVWLVRRKLDSRTRPRSD